MTVKELIKELLQHPDDMEVFVGSICEEDNSAEVVAERPKSYNPHSPDNKITVLEIL